MSDEKKQMKDEATPKAQTSGKGSFTDLGLLPPDDPVYSTGLLVSGRKVVLPDSAPPQSSSESPETKMEPKRGKGGNIDLGLLPPDDPVYRMGLLVAGRPLYPPRKNPTEE
jgi:hypothetical protein